MAILKQISTQVIFAGGIKDAAHATHTAQEAGVANDDFELIYQEQEVQALRRASYSKESDYLFFDYMAAVTEFGEQSSEATTAKESWLAQRNAIKATYAKPQ
ncbi:hypothetical protein PSECIP111951_01135 [Pseudoalteromonas holothuriae]|uniref:Uncharacterized protein n=1 Tax=Pseudoalteromonas holothuriae TaxID=2963714 RepID=A0ABM9GI02_9GAMM|nr:hypothetical protein [Pseudoalteromonas sp. CIP111951]CAH9054911.1 hypothetical protein PSECIP111951_01135 [Pseudoalteromonas sp. CIP111951]